LFYALGALRRFYTAKTPKEKLAIVTLVHCVRGALAGGRRLGAPNDRIDEDTNAPSYHEGGGAM
jgi:hypothetical protein